MSKKHFIELALMVRNCKPDPERHPTERVNANLYRGKIEQWATMRAELARFCKSQNSRFNQQRWIDFIDGVCGPSGGPVKTVKTITQGAE